MIDSELCARACAPASVYVRACVCVCLRACARASVRVLLATASRVKVKRYIRYSNPTRLIIKHSLKNNNDNNNDD